jgi:hypothetical protein
MIGLRTALTTAATAALVGTLGLTGPAHASMTAATEGPQPGATVARGGGDGVNPITAARDATRKYKNFRHAKHAGYGLFKDAAGIACISKPPMGGMGIHFAKAALVGDGKIRLRHPEALVYHRENGHRHLVALEYVVLKQDWENIHGANAHRPRLYGHRFNLTHKGNRFGLPAYYSLHAWIWKHNPAGTFEMWNPNVHCSCCG